MSSEAPVAAPPAPSAPRGWRAVFFGPRRLRAGWRLLILIAVFQLVGLTIMPLIRVTGLEVESQWTPRSLTLQELLFLYPVLVGTLVIGWIDRRGAAAFGLPLRQALGRRFWEGTMWGLLAVGLLVGAIALFDGYRVNGLAVHGAVLARAVALWIVAMLLVGGVEELAFRGVLQTVLADGIGFWPAAIILSAGFGAIHYFGKPMENLTDAASVTLIGLFLCVTLWRTGSLWFAVGFHFAFDFAALALFGAPNTGNNGRPAAEHLLNGYFAGPDWLTGGVRGIEASMLVFPLIALLFAAFLAAYRPPRRA
jgi:CAAX protease family protein